MDKNVQPQTSNIMEMSSNELGNPESQKNPRISAMISQYENLLALVDREIEEDRKIQECLGELYQIRRELPGNMADYTFQRDLIQEKSRYHQKLNALKAGNLPALSEGEFEMLRIEQSRMETRIMQKRVQSGCLLLELKQIKERLEAGEKIVNSEQKRPNRYKLNYLEIPQEGVNPKNRSVIADDISKATPYEAMQHSHWREYLKKFLEENAAQNHYQYHDGKFYVSPVLFEQIRQDEKMNTHFEIVVNHRGENAYLIIKNSVIRGEGQMFMISIADSKEIENLPKELVVPKTQFTAPVGTGHIKFKTLVEQARQRGEIAPKPRQNYVAEPSPSMSEVYRAVSAKADQRKQFLDQEVIEREKIEAGKIDNGFTPFNREIFIRKYHVDKMLKLCALLRYNPHSKGFAINKRYASALVNLPGYKADFRNNRAYLTVQNPLSCDPAELQPFEVKLMGDTTMMNLPVVRRAAPAKVGFLGTISALWKGFKTLFAKKPMQRQVRTFPGHFTNRTR